MRLYTYQITQMMLPVAGITYVYKQHPQEAIDAALDHGWKPVAVTHGNYLILTKRLWFWQKRHG